MGSKGDVKEFFGMRLAWRVLASCWCSGVSEPDLLVFGCFGTGPTQSFLQDLKQSYQFKNKAPTLLEDHWGISNLSLVALFLVWQPCFQSAQNSLLTQFFGCQLVFLSSTFFEENTSSSPKFCLLKWSARHVKMVC